VEPVPVQVDPPAAHASTATRPAAIATGTATAPE